MTKINKVCKQFSFVSILSNAAVFGLTRHIRNFISGLTLFFFSLTRYVQYLIQLIAISNIYKVISCWTNQLTACIYIIIIAYAICINPNFIQYVTYLAVEYSPWILNGLESIFDYINLAKGGGSGADDLSKGGVSLEAPRMNQPPRPLIPALNLPPRLPFPPLPPEVVEATEATQAVEDFQQPVVPVEETRTTETPARLGKLVGVILGVYLIWVVIKRSIGI